MTIILENYSDYDGARHGGKRRHGGKTREQIHSSVFNGGFWIDASINSILFSLIINQNDKISRFIE